MINITSIYTVPVALSDVYFSTEPDVSTEINNNIIINER